MATVISAAFGLGLILGRFHGGLVGIGTFFLTIAGGMFLYTIVTEMD